MSRFYWNPETLEDMLYSSDEDVYNFCYHDTDWGDSEDLDSVIEDFTQALKEAERKDFNRMMQIKQSDLCEIIQDLKRQLASK